MNTKIVALTLLLFAAVSAAQTTTYVYTSQPIDFSDGYYTHSLPIVITGSVTLAQPLPLNGTTVLTPVDPGFYNASTPVSASFIGNLFVSVGQPDQNAPYGSLANAVSFTTKDGVITAWHVIATSSGGNEAYTVTLDSVTGDDYYIDNFAGDCNWEPQKCYTEDYHNTTPGTWSVPQAAFADEQGALAWWTARAWQVARERASYLNGYLDAIALIKRLNAAIAKCRATGGKC